MCRSGGSITEAAKVGAATDLAGDAAHRHAVVRLLRTRWRLPGAPTPAEILRVLRVGSFDDEVAALTATAEARARKLLASCSVDASLNWINRAWVDGIGLWGCAPRS